MKDNVVEYYRDRVYGVVKNYVKEPKVAEAISLLTGRKTLSEGDMKALGSLGFKFAEVLNDK